MKGRTLQPISMSSLEQANWSRGPEWRLNSNSRVILMLHHTWAGLTSTGEAERTQGFSLSSVTLLQSQKMSPTLSKISLPEETSQTREVGQLTRNNYKHLLLRSWKTNTCISKNIVFSVFEANCKDLVEIAKIKVKSSIHYSVHTLLVNSDISFVSDLRLTLKVWAKLQGEKRWCLHLHQPSKASLSLWCETVLRRALNECSSILCSIGIC